ncbi:DUF4129 domain-containing protein [Aestuariimicrobium kwangyangense]|uniref:DUF4129 domain-containing protein n=1 Tax=Aestuariimicrobium kwangyangense TaxID=396389 RepID=UPI0003B67644|nr:DUF4129 domain-containing protein [Aestuariimicrobium kwangyangense]
MLPLQAPVRPSPDEARRWLAEELAHRGYERPISWLERWLNDLLRRLLDQSLPSPDTQGVSVVVALLVVAVLALVVVLVWRARPEARRRRATAASSALVDSTLSADDYRRLAAEFLARGEVDQALIHAFRAIVADMVRRTVLGRRPGDTAQEVAAAVARVFPAHGQGVHRAADLFDQAAYRHREGLASTITPADVGSVQALDEGLGSARPQHHTAADLAATTGVAP